MPLSEIVKKEFEASGAILNSHFILSSGLHNDTYLQCARVLMNTKRADRLCKILATKLVEQFGVDTFDVVVAPAMGGVILGYEMARQLNIDGIFCERVNGQFALRRGFEIPKNAKILVVEDVVTTGKSSLEAFECIERNGGIVIAEACLIDRSNGAVDLGVPLISLAVLEVKTYSPDSLPAYLENIEAIKPGSRWLGKK